MGDEVGWAAEDSKLRFLVETFSLVMYMAKLYATIQVLDKCKHL